MTKSREQSDDGANSPGVNPRNTLAIQSEPGADRTTILARFAASPTTGAALTTQIFSKQLGLLDITALVGELANQANAVTNGDLQRPESMLVAQAHALDAIFHELARRAALNMGEYLGAAETFMRLALKAQTQCRATLETLAAIKNPAPVAFVRQANISHGPQQVNNVAQHSVDTASRARESENPPNKLLEQKCSERLDT